MDMSCTDSAANSSDGDSWKNFYLLNTPSSVLGSHKLADNRKEHSERWKNWPGMIPSCYRSRLGLKRDSEFLIFAVAQGTVEVFG